MRNEWEKSKCKWGEDEDEDEDEEGGFAEGATFGGLGADDVGSATEKTPLCQGGWMQTA